MNNAPLNVRSATLIVIASVISAFLAGGIVLGIGLSNPESPQKAYTFLSFIIGQTFMLVPLIWYLISKNQPIIKTLRLKSVSPSTIFKAFNGCCLASAITTQESIAASLIIISMQESMSSTV